RRVSSSMLASSLCWTCPSSPAVLTIGAPPARSPVALVAPIPPFRRARATRQRITPPVEARSKTSSTTARSLSTASRPYPGFHFAQRSSNPKPYVARRQGSAVRLRIARARNAHVASSAATCAREERHLRRHPRARRRRVQSRRAWPADGGRKGHSRASGHHRRDHHHALGGLRRRQAGARLCLHTAEPVGLPGKGP